MSKSRLPNYKPDVFASSYNRHVYRCIYGNISLRVCTYKNCNFFGDVCFLTPVYKSSHNSAMQRPIHSIFATNIGNKLIVRNRQKTSFFFCRLMAYFCVGRSHILVSIFPLEIFCIITTILLCDSLTLAIVGDKYVIIKHNHQTVFFFNQVL